MNEAVIVTGGAGFLGSNLCQTLANAGHRVLAIDNFSTARKQNRSVLEQHPQIEVLEGDVCSDWGDLLQGKDMSALKWVFHLASPASPPLYQAMPIQTMWANSVGLRKALEWAETHGARCVYSSTSEVYGDPEVNPQAESYWGRVNPFGERSCYDESKRFGEALLYSFNQMNHARHGLVRIFNTYGPGMNVSDGRVVINFLTQAMRGHSLTVYGDGKQTRSFCYVDDLVAGLIKYASSDLREPINLGNPVEITMLQLADAVMKLFPESKLSLEFKGLPADDPQCRRPDIRQAQEKLAWEPQVSLQEGLGRMLAWLKENV